MRGDLARDFHEQWLGMIQPSEGLVVSIPVLVDPQCMHRHGPAEQERLRGILGSPPRIADLARFLRDYLGLPDELFDSGDSLPEALSLYVPEGGQTLRPTLAMRKTAGEPEPARGNLPDESTPSSRAGAAYQLLAWEVPDGLDLDRAETVTGTWDYPLSAKFDRLLRAARVPVGLLCNGRALRLCYAPHGESSGSLTFRCEELVGSGGRPLLDALLMLLSAHRWLGVLPEQRLPALLRDSRLRQANVTNALADQVFEALELLLAGFESAAQRDGTSTLEDALRRGEAHVYGGLLTVLLRLVFLLYAEDRRVMPVEDWHYSEHLSVRALFETLQADQASHPDSMSRRFGAWPRRLALFRAVFLGVRHGSLQLPARGGALFDPAGYPFLEGWSAGGAPIVDPTARANTRVPTVDDETVFRVLEKLVYLEGQRLSYQTLDVEQIGSVYEALMGYHVRRLTSSGLCLKPDRVWVCADELLEQPPKARAGWLSEHAGVEKKAAKSVASALEASADEAAILEALAPLRARSKAPPAAAGRLVLQPGEERRRTSSHYTPRSLSAPIVRKTLEPLLAAMGGEPASERLLNLKICDPAMGSGAFLVEACRFLADQVVAAWTREGRSSRVASAREDVVLQARRLVAQRCLYGVDKNPYAVTLAKMSLWLVTLAKDEPFTFLDHALKTGDSLVGLGREQLESFHWAPGKQKELFASEVREALAEALGYRERILELAREGGEGLTHEKERLLGDADAALDRARLIADLVVGAFFEGRNPKEREAERKRRLGEVHRWLGSREPAPDELREMQRRLREKVPAFHWMLEFPEVFHGERPDPLDRDETNAAAWMDAFVGNPPFAGKNGIAAMGEAYLPWLQLIHEGAHGNADYSAHFFRRAFELIGLHGTVGLIATNTIAQGDTRSTGLQAILAAGGKIQDATRSMKWPGEANVAVSVVHLVKGHVAEIDGLEVQLDGKRVEVVNSRLRAKPERPDPKPLPENAGLSYVGAYVLGMGFTLRPEQRDALAAKDPRNAERIFPYLGGEEVNTSPTQSFDRYVINFGQMSLEEAESWPDLIAIVRREVKPERDKNKRDGYRRHWWLFGEYRAALNEALTKVSRCLVISRVTKHLCISIQPSNRVLAETTVVFPDERPGLFAALQSRLHETWARLLSSSMRTDLRYSPSDCFETFPLPPLEGLAGIADRLNAVRARLMVARNEGLTKTYNRLKDAECRDEEILELRGLHEELDRAVLEAYGWSDIEVPPYPTATTDEEKARLESFEDEVLDRLFALNTTRARSPNPRAAEQVNPTGGFHELSIHTE